MFSQVFLVTAVELNRKWFARLRTFEVSIKCHPLGRVMKNVCSLVNCLSHLEDARQMQMS